MRKIFYNSIVAKILLCLSACTTITIGCFICTKKSSLTQRTINHESIHVCQFNELFVLTSAIVMISTWIFNAPLFILVIPFISWWLFYGLEWLIRLFISIFKRKIDLFAIYKSLSFEREAYGHEYDDHYVENRRYFSWFKLL